MRESTSGVRNHPTKAPVAHDPRETEMDEDGRQRYKSACTCVEMERNICNERKERITNKEKLNLN